MAFETVFEMRAENDGARARARKAERKAYQRDRDRVLLRDVQRFKRLGLVAPQLEPIVQTAQDEARAVILDLGGREDLSAMELSMVEDHATLGILMRAELSRYLGGNLKAAQGIAGLAAGRKQILVALGIKRRKKVETLEGWMDSKGEVTGP